MIRNPRRRIPRFACASILASALAFSIAAPVSQAAPQAPAKTTASKATASVPGNSWCDRHPRKCGRGGGMFCTTVTKRVYNSATGTYVDTYKKTCTRRS